MVHGDNFNLLGKNINIIHRKTENLWDISKDADLQKTHREN